MGVRFISILDNYDSYGEGGDADQIIVPFKNLINDSYCRDISMKIRSQLAVKRRNGKYIGSFACYGYLKDPEDKNHLVVDEVAAEVIRQIFRMKLDGYNLQRISDALNEMGVLTPADYKRSIGMNYDCGFKSGSNSKWSPVNVSRVLKNEILTGTMVQGIHRKINYKVKQSRNVASEDWIRVENTHEPIISRADFDEVQRLFELDTRTAPGNDTVELFSGIVICGDCGQNMIRRTSKRNGKSITYLHCSTYKNGNGCSSHLIRYDALEAAVLESIQKQISLLVEAEQVLKRLDKISEDQGGVKIVDNQLETMEKEVARYMDFKSKAYMDMLDGVIDKDEFQEISRRFTGKIEEAKKKQEELQKKRYRMIHNKSHTAPWMQDLKKYHNIQELSRRMLTSIVERIVIYDKTNIQIVFRYGEEMEEMLGLAGITESEVAVCE